MPTCLRVAILGAAASLQDTPRQAKPNHGTSGSLAVAWDRVELDTRLLSKTL
jgi:hypothetical protein